MATLRQTGASHLLLTEVPQESLNIPTEILDDLLSSIAAKDSRYAQLQINGPNRNEIYVVDTNGDSLVFQKVQLAHSVDDGSEMPFNLSRESMGTRRLVQLLPLFFELASSEHEGKTFIVDELNRSFHTALTYDLIKLFLEGCDETTRKQLIFTTHDLLLMKHDKIRRDEQWIAENSTADGTELFCIGVHGDARVDKNLLKAYQDGAFGTYPVYE